MSRGRGCQVRHNHNNWTGCGHKVHPTCDAWGATMDVSQFLRELGLQQYEVAFRDNGVDDRVLPKLTAEDLKDLGVAMVGHRRLLLEAIAALREPTTPAEAVETEDPPKHSAPISSTAEAE